MSLFEVLLILSTLGLLVTFWYRRFFKLFLVLGSLILLLQLTIEGYHWQMIPVYTAFILTAILCYSQTGKRTVKIPVLTFIVFLLITGSALAYLIPVFNFPKPSGSYSVGSKQLFLKDTTRLEPISDEEGDFRRLTVNVYYPSKEQINTPNPYMEDGSHEAYAGSVGMPELIFSHFTKVNTHIQQDISMAPKKLPVIILSHGLGWNTQMYTALISELVSRGYLVFGIDHTFESVLTIYEEEKIYSDRKVLDDMDRNLNFDSFEPLLEDFKNEQDSLQKKLKMQHMTTILPYNESLDRWTADISFVLDQILEKNEDQESFLFQKLDAKKIGMIGHSWGGAAVVQNASIDPRAKAVVNMEGAQWGRVIDTTLTSPLMAIFADRNYEEFFTPNFFVYDQITSENYYEVIIANTGHASFGDIPFWTRMPEFTDTGDLHAEKLTFLTADLIHKFFSKYLNDRESNLVQFFDDSRYPEVKLIKRK